MSIYIFKKFLLFILSPDFSISKYLKISTFDFEKLKRDKAEQIKIWNIANLWIDLILFFVILFFIKIGLLNIILLKFFVIVFISYRVISRSIEIIIAFGKDATSDPKNNSSDLTKYNRIGLAIKSYFNIIIMYASFYLVIFNDFFNSILNSFGISTFTNVPNILEQAYCSPIFSWNNFFYLFVYLQVITTLSLVVLSLAVYASRNDKEKNHKNSGVNLKDINKVITKIVSDDKVEIKSEIKNVSKILNEIETKIETLNKSKVLTKKEIDAITKSVVEAINRSKNTSTTKAKPKKI
ncbi:MAG: hypothetical protein ACRCSK_08055 [Fusobacteriaceae bacterium]